VITGLIVAGGGFQGLPMLRALHAFGARVVVADSLAENPNVLEADAYVVVPPLAERAALTDALRRLCEQWQVDVVFPTTDRDLSVVADLGPELRGAGLVVAAPPPQLLRAWTDKVVLLEALRAAALPVLPISTGDRLLSAFPLLGKPRRGWGSQGVVTAASAGEFAAVLARDAADELFWQPRLDRFAEWSADFAIDESGRISPIVTRERLRVSGGFAVVSRVDARSPVDDVAHRTAQWLAGQGTCGIVNVQFLVEPAGAIWVNDVNLRPGTSSGAALAAGVNFAAFMLGRNLPVAAPMPGVFLRTLADRYVPLPFPRPVAGVALDLDDCLIDHKAWMDDKLAIVLDQWSTFADVGLRAPFEAAARRLIDEGPWDRLLEVALRACDADPMLLATLIERWRAAHPATLAVHADALALVEALHSAGIRIAIVTDNPVASQRQKLARLPCRDKIDAVVFTAELDAAKPNPRGYLTAALQLGVDPGDMVAVGDSPWRDGLGAVHAGYAGAVIAARRGAMGNSTRERFSRAHPEADAHVHWVHSLLAVPRMLGLGQPTGGAWMARDRR
jgi:HAD superfamily hydrolase (TIGR01509 family)